jgi:hypothetical protein
MQTWRVVAFLGLLTTVWLGTACNQPQVNHPLVGQTKYLCCNLHYEKDEMNDNPYQVGVPVKLGTKVSIIEVRKNSVKFQPDGHPAITLKQKYGDKVIPFETYLDRLFVDRNPMLKFGKKRDKLEQAVVEGRVVKGMSKEHVAMAVGYPAGHQTPSLEQDSWRYWENRWHQYVVWFVNGRVDRVQQ